MKNVNLKDMDSTLKLKPEIKELWCAALESKKYPQATGGLRSDTGFCCLGVLGDLAVKAGVAEWVGEILRSGGTLHRSYFPNALLKWACSETPENLILDEGTPWPIPRRICEMKVSLAGLNDRGMTFPEIAEVIRKHF